jgi:YHS domain-containing protein
MVWLGVVTFLGIGGSMGLAGGAFARPFDTVNYRRDARLMLGGPDPISYYKQARPTPGRPDIRVEIDGVIYRFASEAARAEFQRDPARWVPAFGGHCAYGMVHAVPIPARADVFEILDSRLYMFSSERSRAWFLMEREINLQLASRWWRYEVGGSIVVLQRAYRTIVPVPNRRDPEDLERDYRDRLHTGRL